MFSMFLLGFHVESKINPFRVLYEAWHEEACMNSEDRCLGIMNENLYISVRFPEDLKSLMILKQKYFHPGYFK